MILQFTHADEGGFYLILWAILRSVEDWRRVLAADLLVWRPKSWDQFGTKTGDLNGSLGDFFRIKPIESSLNLVEPMGFEPTNPIVSPDDSIGLGSPNPRKTACKSPVLDRNWTELFERIRD